MAGITCPIVPITRDPAIIAQRVVKRSTVKTQILRLGLAHRIEKLETRDIGVALCGDQCDLRVQQFLLGVKDLDDRPRADTLLGPVALEGKLISLDRNGLGLDSALGCIVAGEGRTGRLDHRTLGPDDLFERLTLLGLRLANSGSRQTALKNWNIGTNADGRLRTGVR